MRDTTDWKANQSKQCKAETDCGALDGSAITCKLDAAWLNYSTEFVRGSERTTFYCSKSPLHYGLAEAEVDVVFTGYVNDTCHSLTGKTQSIVGDVRTEVEFALP